MVRLTPWSLLFLLALLIRVGVALVWRFDGLYGQDAYAYLHQGLAIAANASHGQRPPADFFWPNGYPILIALWSTVFGPSALAAQWPSLLMGAALAPLVYGVSVALLPQHGQRAGWVAGLIVAVAGQPILSSVSAMSDMPALFWATLAVWLMVRRQTVPGGGRRSAVGGLVGVVLGLAVITRWLYILLAPAVAVYAAYQAIGGAEALRYPDKARSSGLDGRWRWPALGALGWLALGGAVIVLPQLGLSLHRPEGLAHQWLLGWSPANALRRDFVTADGYLSYRLPPALYNLEPAIHPAFMFPLLGGAVGWGVVQLWRRRAWDTLSLLLGWAGAMYLFLAGIPYENFRFGLSLYPPLTILAGYGVAEMLTTRWRRVVGVATALSLVGMLVWAGPMLNNFLTTQNGSKVIAHQTTQLLPADSTLLTFGLTFTMQYYTSLEVIELFYETPATLRTRVCGGPPTYALLDVPGIEAQWGGREPGIALQWLRDGPGLLPITQWDNITLFKVGERCL